MIIRAPFLGLVITKGEPMTKTKIIKGHWATKTLSFVASSKWYPNEWIT